MIIVGDSHTQVFNGRGNIHTNDPNIFTQRDFINSIADTNSALTNFFQNNQGNSLILCLGEIEARGHWWKHLPVSYVEKNTINNYLVDRAEQIYQALKTVAITYNLPKAVLWGAPPAVIKNDYNPHWPFVGSRETRNIMLHIFSCAFINCVLNDPTENRIGFATGFYDYINPEEYSPADGILSDGVHWKSDLNEWLWNIVSPVVNSNSKFYVGDLFNTMKENHFIISENTVSVNNYDTWVNSKDIKNTEELTRKINVNGNEYYFLKFIDRNKFSDQYRELILKKVI